MREEITVLQHNVQAWTPQKKNLLSNIYLRIKPDVILLNSTSILDNEKLNIYNYNIYKKNKFKERHAGIAIGVKKDIKHKIIDNYTEDFLTIQIETTKGPINITTAYQPPRRNYILNQDLSPIIHSNIPSYIIGDLNAIHHFIGHSRDNNVGRTLNHHIRNNLLTHLGPNFNTLTEKLNARTICRPDIILTNKRAIFNHDITQGPIAPSDHIPLIIKLSTKPIISEIISSPNIKKTNWELFSTKVQNNITEQENDNKLDNQINITRDTLDKSYKTWIYDIKNSFEQCTPMKKI